MIGAGAVGGGIGGRLAQAGQPVVLVARGAHLAALRRGGLRLVTPEQDVRIPVEAAGSVEEVALTADDVLVLAVKTQQAPEVLPIWADAPVLGGGTAGERLPLVVALNGVAAESMALRYFARVYGACVWMWANHLHPGQVVLSGSPTTGLFHLGRVPAAAADDLDAVRLDRIRQEWAPALLDVRLPADVMPWKYGKLITNLGNAYQALVGDQRGLRRLIGPTESEARAVLAAAGIAVTSEEEESEARRSYTVVEMPAELGFLGGSTWQSLARGTGNVETDYLNGEIVLIARQHGLDAPLNARAAALVRRAARGGRGAGTYTVGRLAAALGL